MPPFISARKGHGPHRENVNYFDRRRYSQARPSAQRRSAAPRRKPMTSAALPDGQTGEVAERHQPSSVGVMTAETGQSLVEHHQIVWTTTGAGEVFGEIDAVPAARHVSRSVCGERPRPGCGAWPRPPPRRNARVHSIPVPDELPLAGRMPHERELWPEESGQVSPRPFALRPVFGVRRRRVAATPWRPSGRRSRPRREVE